MCFPRPWSPSQPLLGSRCWVWRRWMKPGYGASEEKRIDFIGTFFVLRPSLVSGFYPDGLQIIRLCWVWRWSLRSGWTCSLVSAVVLFIEKLLECKRSHRGKPALPFHPSIHSFIQKKKKKKHSIRATTLLQKVGNESWDQMMDSIDVHMQLWSHEELLPVAFLHVSHHRAQSCLLSEFIFHVVAPI